MSTLLVEVCEIVSKRPAPAADRLEVITVKGWDVVVQKALDLQPGQKVVYFPPDSVMPETLADKLGIKKYLSPVKSPVDGSITGYRVRAARLRGESSFGTIDHEVDPSWEVGQDLKEHFGVTKWEPPLRCQDGDAERPHPAFHAYTEIENIRNFPDILIDGEEVVMSEKLHGMNARIGYIRDTDDAGNSCHVFMAGSHGVRRKEQDAKGAPCKFWMPLTETMRENLRSIASMYGDYTGHPANVVLFGELINTQKGFTYGVKQGTVGFRAFDITINGHYVNYEAKRMLFSVYEIETVPILYRGPFSWALVKQMTDGPTTACEPNQAGAFRNREGVVVTPVVERFDPQLPGSGRVILKSISADYLEYYGKRGVEEAEVSDA